MTQKRDPYEILGVGRDADQDAIKRSYRKLAVKFHPDKNPGDAEAEDRFKELGEAYDILMDPDKRAAFDRYGHAAFAPGGRAAGGFHDPFDLFREVFGASGGGGGGGGIFEQFFGGGRSETSGRGSDLRYDLQITLEEAAVGCEKEIEIRKLDTCDTCDGSGAQDGSSAVTCQVCGGRGQVVASRGFFQVAQTCPSCHGTGRVIQKPCRSCGGEGRKEKTSRVKLKIPAGIDEGSRLRSSGGGEAGLRGAANGDLYVVVHIREHEIFVRDGLDLHCEMPVPFGLASLGGEMRVPVLGGSTVSVKVPAGTQGGTTFRVRGQGIQPMRGSSRGDLLVRVHVEVPTRLNSEQRKALEKFAELCGEENTPLHKTFTDRIKEFFT